MRVPVIPRWEGPDPELDPELFTAGPPPVVMPAESLEALIRDIRDAGKPLIGVCFGHQIIAHAWLKAVGW